MNSWKKQLKKEIASRTPKLNDDVKNAKIPEGIMKQEIEKKKNGFKIFWAFPTALLAMLILTIGLWIFLKPVSTSHPVTYVYSMDINPSVVFVTDEKGMVLSVTSLNEDADVLLSYSNDLKNKSISEAMTTCVDVAVRLGYFDISMKGDAVRIKGLQEDDTNQLVEVKEALESYFCKKGFWGVIVEEKVTLAQFCQELGVDSFNTMERLTEQIQSFGTMFGERGVNENNLPAIYEEYVLGTQLLDHIAKIFQENVDLIYENATLLLRIFSLNTEIMMHKDNPASLLKDYWSVKQNYTNFTSPFAKMLLEMENLIKEYELSFNMKLQTLQDVANLLTSYSSISLEDIKSLTDISVSDFIASPEKYIAILKNIGLEVSNLEEILIMPTSLEEYRSQLNSVLSILSSQKEAIYKDAYEEVRVEVEIKDYQAFITEIEAEYGSLKNYWENQKK
ncbi:MAG: hypothetical protein K2N64_04545 [Anaeroplasmataceae bacterium]|nr:hypothetical protein [Anaeroplasmataceae bacterium]